MATGREKAKVRLLLVAAMGVDWEEVSAVIVVGTKLVNPELSELIISDP